MTDTTKPEPGWYVFTRLDGRWDCQWRISDEVFTEGCTAVSIADLLRDAARYRWLEENAIVEPGGSAVIHAHWDCDDSFTGFDAAIDAEIARESSQ